MTMIEQRPKTISELETAFSEKITLIVKFMDQFLDDRKKAVPEAADPAAAAKKYEEMCAKIQYVVNDIGYAHRLHYHSDDDRQITNGENIQEAIRWYEKFARAFNAIGKTYDCADEMKPILDCIGDNLELCEKEFDKPNGHRPSGRRSFKFALEDFWERNDLVARARSIVGKNPERLAVFESSIEPEIRKLMSLPSVVGKGTISLKTAENMVVGAKERITAVGEKPGMKDVTGFLTDKLDEVLHLCGRHSVRDEKQQEQRTR